MTIALQPVSFYESNSETHFQSEEKKIDLTITCDPLPDVF